MKVTNNLLVKVLVLTILPFMASVASADLREDMVDPQMTLVDIVGQALAEGMSIESIVAEMIDIDPSLSSGVVAAAIVVYPQGAEAIVATAIAAGADSTQVVRSAIAASNAKGNQNLVNMLVRAAIKADPNNALNIVNSASRASGVDANTIAAAARGMSRQVDRALAGTSALRPVVAFNPTSTLGDRLVGLKDGVDAVASPSDRADNKHRRRFPRT